MTKITHFDQLPADYDTRLTAVLGERVPANVILRFVSMAASKNPSANYRWDLARDGRLFVVHHSGRNPSAELPFDRPLPAVPSRKLSVQQITELFAKLDAADYFDQPALQRPALSEGGAYVLVRARRDGTLHDVVYENISNPLIDYLEGVAG